ncbi:MAG TPA: histone deacetylase [Nitrospirota bacterium]|nr:histone deacetylase [Nitrospirota bacterium]
MFRVFLWTEVMSYLALIKDDRYLEHHAGEGHPESPNRLRVLHDLINAEFSGLPLIPPRLATENELALVHDPLYIQMVANTEGKAFSRLDPDTGLSARSYEIARLAAGGLLQAIDSLLTHEPRTPKAVFAFVRPPGHHAEPSRGMGFCIFNNVAIAAEYAREKFGLKRILIVDWDLHHGNGTQHAFYDSPAVLYFSSHQYPYYPGSGSFEEVGSGAGEGFTINAPLPAGFGDAEYVRIYSTVLLPVALEYKPELVLVSAGFDPFVRDPLGSMKMSGEGFGALTGIVHDIAQTTCDGKILITLEGGYNPDGLRSGVRSVLRTLLGRPAEIVVKEPADAAYQVIERIISTQRKYWKSLR